MLTPEQEREAYQKFIKKMHAYCDCGYDEPTICQNYWIARIAARESALREDIAKEVEKLKDTRTYVHIGTQRSVNIHNQGLEDAIRAIRGDKK